MWLHVLSPNSIQFGPYKTLHGIMMQLMCDREPIASKQAGTGVCPTDQLIPRLYGMHRHDIHHTTLMCI